MYVILTAVSSDSHGVFLSVMILSCGLKRVAVFVRWCFPSHTSARITSHVDGADGELRGSCWSVFESDVCCAPPAVFVPERLERSVVVVSETALTDSIVLFILALTRPLRMDLTRRASSGETPRGQASHAPGQATTNHTSSNIQHHIDKTVVLKSFLQ